MRDSSGLSRGLDKEVRTAVAEGLVHAEVAAQLAEDARHLGRSPLELLLDRGQITATTLASLRLVAAGMDDVHDTPSAIVHVRSPQATAPSGDAAAVFPVTGWDRYEPVRLLGQGAMGRVFLARDLRLRREVALKFMRGDDHGLARRFVAEARAQARVSHEHVCKVYEVGEPPEPDRGSFSARFRPRFRPRRPTCLSGDRPDLGHVRPCPAGIRTAESLTAQDLVSAGWQSS